MQKFGKRVYKAPINAGFTCPNIDGTKGTGGCIYCDGGSGYFTDSNQMPIAEQLAHQIALIHEKHPDAGINAYFQSYSNTYAPVELLKERFEPVLQFKDIVALSIATRADCLSDEILDYLSQLSAQTELSVELGLQTIHDKTAEIINRGHTYKEFLKGYYSLKEKGIRTTVHIINGLPGENEEMMLQTAYQLGRLRPDGLKIHLLHVIKGTKLNQMYNNGDYVSMSMNDYVRIAVKQLEYIPPETVIERITGDGDKSKLTAPMWSKNKIAVLGAIDKLQVQTDSYQGKYYTDK